MIFIEWKFSIIPLNQNKLQRVKEKNNTLLADTMKTNLVN